MCREEFIYQYLLTYNTYEKEFAGEDAVSFWKKRDRVNGTSGMIFMVLRNALVHNTLETIIQIEEIISYGDIIEALKDCKLDAGEKIKYMDIVFKNKKVIKDLEDKGFKVINTSREDVFKLFQKKESEFYISILFSHSNLLFETTVSTYNHKNNNREYFEDYYIESELCGDEFLIKFFKKDESILLYHIDIYIDKKYKKKTFYHSINLIDIVIISDECENNLIKKINKEQIDEMQVNELKAFLNEYITDRTVKLSVEKVKNAYNSLDNFLHVVGIQNNL